MKFYLISLGCAKNLVDSEKITEHLCHAGYPITDRIEDASLVLINTCGFIKDAKKESIETILSLLEEKPKNARMVIFGCLVQRYQKELKKLIPEVDLFLPILSPEDFAREIKKYFPSQSEPASAFKKNVLFTPPSYTYIKIAEGCRNFCSYCTIPLIRGSLSSYSPDNIVHQIKDSLTKGIYEINLIAQDLTAYGKDLHENTSLESLLPKILSIKRDFWIRLLYLYPSRISPALIKIIHSDTRIVKYIDMPVQHVNNRILKLMHRDYTSGILEKKIEMLRAKIPSIVIRTSLMVGFPTETEEDFQELTDFVRRIQFDHLGVFEYSPEEDTSAFSLRPRVPVHMKKQRRKKIMDIQKCLVREKNMTLTGKIFPCLIELPVDEYGAVWTGRIYSQAPEVDGIVYVTGYNASMGKVVNIRAKGFKDYDLFGECV
jgi:ribosomal protein S12 methylthiotransferase